jgi:hypothetical protein
MVKTAVTGGISRRALLLGGLAFSAGRQIIN